MTLWTVPRRRADGMRTRTRLLARHPWQGWGLVLVGVVLLGACAPADEGGGARASLSGSPTEAAPSAADISPEPQIDPMPTDGTTPVGGGPWSSQVSDACADSVGDAYVEVAQSADADGVTSFWTSSRRWAVCDVLLDPTSDGTLAVTTNTSPRAAAAGFDEPRLSLSTTAVGPEAAPDAVRFVAGGLLPWPVQEIAYTFPDGHLEQASFVESDDGSGDTWWVVAYTAGDGPLVDPSSTSEELEPVTISIVGAAAEAFRLPWEDLQRTE